MFGRFEDELRRFEPRTEREKILHADVIHTLGVLIGGGLNLLLIYPFWVDRLLSHILLVGIFATFIGLMIFLTAAMDNAF